MKSARLHLRLAVFAATLAALAGCRHAHRAPGDSQAGRPAIPAEAERAPTGEGLEVVRTYVGRPCRVQFRRDALGLAAPAPLGPTSERVGMNFAVLAGTLERVTSAGVLLKTAAGPKWIPWPSILLIELQDHS